MPTTTPASTRPRGRHRRRLATSLAALVVTATALAACEPPPPDVDPPRWSVSTKPVAVALGPHVQISWPAATGTPSRYRIDVNGVTAAMPAGAATSCVMVGLAATTAHTFKITAYDAAGNWSGSLPETMEAPGFRVASYTTPAGPGGGPTLRCVPAVDADADRLADALETGTGTYAHTAATGTSPTVADTDEDGIGDGDEVLGTAAGLDLRALGATPLQSDLIVEADWLSGLSPSPVCATPPSDLRPSAASLAPAIAAFALVDRPVGEGINLIVDYGQGGAFTGGNAVPDDDGRATLSQTKPAHFDPKRAGYVHYALHLVEFFVSFTGWRAGGLAEYGGDDLQIGHGCTRDGDWTYSSILMHELGHNLHLHHGGNESRLDKPNYNSIMNYRYRYSIDTDCDARSELGANQVLAFSDGWRVDIDEAAVREDRGVCAGRDIDWNGNGVIDATPYSRDLNGDGQIHVLTDWNDIDDIDLAAMVDGNRAGIEEIYDPE